MRNLEEGLPKMVCDHRFDCRQYGRLTKDQQNDYCHTYDHKKCMYGRKEGQRGHFTTPFSDGDTVMIVE